MGRLPSRRALWRLARRDVARHRGPSVLVLAMIALPVAAMVGGAAVFQTSQGTADQQATQLMGAADLQVASPAEEPPTTEEVTGRLPAGSRVSPVAEVAGELTAGGGTFPVRVTSQDVAGLAAGTFRVVAGRLPRGPDELALTRPAAQAADVEVGDRVSVDPAGPATVVGRVLDADQVSSPGVLLPPGTLSSVDRWLVDLPDGDDPEEVMAALTSVGNGLQALPREDAARPSTAQANLVLILGGFALAGAALVAAAAFAISIRRRQRELGLLAAGGGEPQHLRAAVRLSGVLLGLAGSVVGALLGLAGAWAALPAVRGGADRVVDGLVVSPTHVAVAVVLGVVASALAAAVPARGAIRLPIVAALAGRRPPGYPSRRWVVVGLVLVAVGGGLVVGGTALLSVPRLPAWTGQTAAPLLVLSGSVLGVVGFGTASPWVLDQLGRLAPRLPLGLRLAVRDTGRFRTRNGPVITAIIAGLAASVALGTALGSFEASERADYQPMLATDQLLVEGPAASEVADRVDAAVQTLATSPLRWAQGPDGPLTSPFAVAADQAGARDGAMGTWPLRAVVGDTATVRALGGGDAAVRALRDGQVVVRWPEQDLHQVQAVRSTEDDQVDLGTVSVHVVPATATGHGQLPEAVYSPATMRRLGIAEQVAAPHAALLRLPGDVSRAQAETARQIAAATPSTTVQVEQGYRNPTAGLQRGVTVAAILVGLAVLAIALALSAVEARADQRTLLAVGADPRIRRNLAAGRAIVLAGIGGVLALPAGLLPAWGVLALVPSVPMQIAWTPVLVAALGMPVVAVAGAWLLTRPTPPWTAHRSLA